MCSIFHITVRVALDADDVQHAKARIQDMYTHHRDACSSSPFVSRLLLLRDESDRLFFCRILSMLEREDRILVLASSLLFLAHPLASFLLSLAISRCSNIRAKYVALHGQRLHASSPCSSTVCLQFLQFIFKLMTALVTS